MKKLLFILFVFLISCSTPEQKIIKSFKEGKLQRYNREVKSAEIYDTIYMSDVLDSLPYFDAKIKVIEQKIESMSNYQDSILKIGYPDSIEHRLLKKGFILKNALERDAEHISYQLGHYYSFYNIDDNIGGYFVKIYTKQDTFDVVVLAKNYSILCPTFVFTNQPLSKSRRNFN